MIVRPAGAGDLLAVLRILAEAPAEPPPAPEQPTADERATWDRMLATPGLTAYLAEVDGRPAGTTTCVLVPNLSYDCAPTAFIEPVVVARSHRRRGVATAMLEAVIADVGAAGADKVQVVSHKRHADDGAHALYRSLGFTAEAEGFRRYLRSAPRTG